MKLIDTTDDILSAFKDRNFSLKTWKNYAQTISPDLISLCETDSEKYPFQSGKGRVRGYSGPFRFRKDYVDEYHRMHGCGR